MLELSKQDVELDAPCTNKEEALGFIVSRMVDGGLVQPDYLAGMVERESQTSTYLGNGIAIPHGTPETRDMVKQTGIKVARFPKGLDWSNGQTVYTAVGIAAKSDEHLGILKKLTHIISSDELSKRLHTTSSPDEVIAILKGEADAPTLSIHLPNLRTGMKLAFSDEARALTVSILRKASPGPQINWGAMILLQPLQLADNLWLLCTLDDVHPPMLAAVQFHSPDLPNALFITLITRGNVHKPFMDQLMALRHSGLIDKLTSAPDPQTLYRLLKGVHAEGKTATCRIPLPHGLHARPAAQLVELVNSLGVDVLVENLDGDGDPVKANSIARLISLGACFGHRLRFSIADNPHVQNQLDSLLREVAKGLGDEPTPLPDDLPVDDSQSTQPAQQHRPTAAPKPGEKIKGLCGAPGMAVGSVFVQQEVTYNYQEQATNPAEQRQRLEDAIATVRARIRERIKVTGTQASSNEAKLIAGMHLALLDDPSLIDDAQELIPLNKSAEWAWHTTYEQLASQQENNPDKLLAERAADFRDVGSQVLSVLTGTDNESNESAPHILVCHELPASKVPMLDPAITLAVVTAVGGVTSHAAILARSAGIPLLVGCGEQVLQIPADSRLIVNCDDQYTLIADSEDAVQQALAEKQTREEAIRVAHDNRMKPAITTDGVQLEVVANVTNSSQIQKALDLGAEGVGLYRSEFVYMEFGREPTVEQQVTEYGQALSLLQGRPFVVRTLDVGGDKPLPYLPMETEENPFLGIRGARLSRLYPDMLKRQLEALIKSGLAADKDENNKPNLKIMFPMICDIHEWRELKQMTADVVNDHTGLSFELGMMVEIPSAALMSDIFAPELDFFSVGTNDLTQYTMAIDRGHPTLSAMADPIHPSILRQIKMTVDSADSHNGWVGVCGELAADPVGSIILAGLGVKELSMSVKAIPLTKSRLREVSMKQAQAMAEAALYAESAQAVRALKPEDF
ncbi:phosphoenolpyruvate--protein phosphotransferase [Parendozoicomonas haliclonae]|uniref:phosphoenolpyruvate--protein phosphotransferase n=1 Tax=Parendozoicomonas haliclonae TaxID=1960125 RepID=A0A1X7ATK8_9GAMM|nr:phosphoenolpyruvate--protein phosphotransferase [Parendozoicomonas haliclonae]SMA50747.1 Phosphoenolpyruvate-protein phosphotransferase [Parendozoicomonas haliclonae]